MMYEEGELESLVCQQDQPLLFKNQYFNSRKKKDLDFFEQLISTINQQTIIPQICNTDEIYFSGLEEIDVLKEDSYQKIKKRKGRPKKNLSKKLSQDQEQFRDSEEDFYQNIQNTKNKNRRQKKKRLVKGNSKNIFQFFYRIIIQYLKKHSDCQNQLFSKSRTINRLMFQQIIKNIIYQKAFSELFQTSYLNREVILSKKLPAETKILYLKKIQVIKDIFMAKKKI